MVLLDCADFFLFLVDATSTVEKNYRPGGVKEQPY